MNKQIPEGWRKSSIGEITSTNSLFSDGDWVESKDQDPTGANRLIQLADIGDGVFINKSSRYMNDEQFERLKCTALEKNDILIARMPEPLGRACLYPLEGGKAATVVDVAILRTKNANHYWLMSAINSSDYRHQIDLNASGTTRTRIARGILSNIEILEPPLPEQQKIATILTSVDTVIEKTRAQIDKLKHLKTGMMQQLLTQGIGHTEFKNTTVGRIPETWKVKTLGDLIKSMDGGVSVNGENREKVLNEIGVLKVSSVFKGQFLPQEHKAVVPEDVSRVRLNPKKDHILFSRANTPLLVGESAYIDKDYHDLFLPDKLWMIDVKDRRQVNVKWLSYILCSEQVRSAITDAATGSSSTMKNISKPSLLGISTVLPPIFEQKKISDMLQSVDEKTIVTIQKLKNLTKIKKALMQDLLTGKVRVQSLKKL